MKKAQITIIFVLIWNHVLFLLLGPEGRQGFYAHAHHIAPCVFECMKVELSTVLNLENRLHTQLYFISLRLVDICLHAFIITFVFVDIGCCFHDLYKAGVSHFVSGKNVSDTDVIRMLVFRCTKCMHACFNIYKYNFVRHL